MIRLLSPLLYFLSGFFRRDPRKAVFGAWMGKKFADNPKYLLQHLAAHAPGLKLIWIAEESVRACIPPDLGIRFVRRGTIEAWRAMLTAGSCFVTHAYTDLASYNLMRGARRVHLGHGLAIKHMGSKDKPLRSRLLTKLRTIWRQFYAYDHYAASSPAHREKLLIENATNNIRPNQIIECGQPRIDFLITHANTGRQAELRTRILARAGIRQAGRIIAYLPTFRRPGMPTFSFGAVDPAQNRQLHDILIRQDAVLLEKCHFADGANQKADQSAAPKRVFNLGHLTDIDTQELLLISDLLITDYSGCYVDFLVLKRPILHFAYDREYYEKSDRGLYFKLEEIAGGPIVGTFDKLCEKITEALETNPDEAGPPPGVSEKLVQYEQGTACQQLTNLVFTSRGVQFN